MGNFHLNVGPQGTPVVTVDSGSGALTQGTFTGGIVNATTGTFTVSGPSGANQVSISGTLTRNGTLVTLSLFRILINNLQAGGLLGGNTVSGGIFPPNTVAAPLSQAAGRYRGVLRNLSVTGQPAVANATIDLACNGGGTVQIEVTSSDFRYQRAQNDVSKLLTGNVTGYDPGTGALSVEVEAFDATPSVQTHVTIAGALAVITSGANVSASGYLSDTRNTQFSAVLSLFTPVQGGCS
jgi:hypothetical protein